MDDDLTQFLRDRLDEDERIARAATPGPWQQSGIGEYGWGVSFSRPGAGVEAEDSDQGRADADHIARHDPHRVLRTVDAHRSIVNDLAAVIQASEKYQGPDYYEGVDACERTLKRLALPYADHPNYRSEWRP